MGKVYKFIQINIYKGKYLDSLVAFLKQENPDFISMQEVTSGVLNLCDDKKLNIFEYLKRELKMDGKYHVDFEISDGEGVSGNAVFSKYPITDTDVLTLALFQEITLERSYDEDFFRTCPSHLLSATSEIEGRKIHLMSWHGSWTAPPTDTERTIMHATKIADLLKSLEEPYIMGCDSNAVIQGKTIGLINKVSNNLMLNSGVLGTTNTEVHKIAPVTYLIDYVFTSKDIKYIDLEVPQITVSDHLPVIAELSF